MLNKNISIDLCQTEEKKTISVLIYHKRKRFNEEFLIIFSGRLVIISDWTKCPEHLHSNMYRFLNIYRVNLSEICWWYKTPSFHYQQERCMLFFFFRLPTIHGSSTVFVWGQLPDWFFSKLITFFRFFVVGLHFDQLPDVVS